MKLAKIWGKIIRNHSIQEMEQSNLFSSVTVCKALAMMVLVFVLSFLSWSVISVKTISSKETITFYEVYYPEDKLSNDIQSLQTKSNLLNLLRYQPLPSGMTREAGKNVDIHDINRALQDWNRKYIKEYIYTCDLHDYIR